MTSLCVCARATQRITELPICLLRTHSIFQSWFYRVFARFQPPIFLLFIRRSLETNQGSRESSFLSHTSWERMFCLLRSGESFSHAHDYFFDFLRTCVSKLMLRHNRTNARLTQFRAWALLCEVSKRVQFAVTSIKRQQFL